MPPCEVRTGVIVHAPPGRVWAVLADLDAYPRWNPLVREVRDGRAEAGAPLFISVRPLGRLASVTVRARIARAEPNVELAWEGELAGPLLTFRHAFRMLPLEGGRTYVDHHERFEGPLALSMAAAVPLLRRSYRRWDQALRARAEGEGAGPRP